MFHAASLTPPLNRRAAELDLRKLIDLPNGNPWLTVWLSISSRPAFICPRNRTTVLILEHTEVEHCFAGE